MNFIQKNTGVIAVVALIIAIIGVFTPAGKIVSNAFGGVTNYDEIDVTALKVGGTNGSRVGPIISSTCSLIYSNSSITASTTRPFDCAVTGVVVGDLVFVQTATTTAALGGQGWSIIGASASSTSGFITVLVGNNTGATANLPREIASSTPYLILHPVSTVPGL